MSSSLAQNIKQELLAMVRDRFSIELPEVAMEVPPRTELGDLAFPVAFDLAKRIKATSGEKRNLREIATSLAEGLKAISGVSRVEVAGAGYLNIFFDRASVFHQLVTSEV